MALGDIRMRSENSKILFLSSSDPVTPVIQRSSVKSKIFFTIKARYTYRTSFTSYLELDNTQKNVALHQVDISMSNCWISW